MSITQVAREAGVSASTVSRYLRGILNVTPPIAEKINDAARHYGYSPRPRESADENTDIVLIVPVLDNPFYSSLCQSIARMGAAVGYRVDIKLSQGDSRQEYQLVDTVARERRYQGLLYAGFSSANKALERVLPAGIRLVLLDESIDDPNIGSVNSVKVDNYSGAYQAVRYLISLGHRRIAYLSGPVDLSTSRDRKRGYQAALATEGIQVDESIVFSGPYTEEFGSSIFPYIIESKEQPTAIFCGSDIAAIGLLGAAEQYGLKIPDDLSVIGCDGIHVGQWLKPALTTLQQPIDSIARSAIELLSHHGESKHVQLPLNLIIRDSTARLDR